jgi:hypothetical protein
MRILSLEEEVFNALRVPQLMLKEIWTSWKLSWQFRDIGGLSQHVP